MCVQIPVTQSLSKWCLSFLLFLNIYRVLIVDPEGESGGTPYRFPVNVVAEDVDVGELLGHVDGTLVSMRKPTLSGLPYSHSPDVPTLTCFRKVGFHFSFATIASSYALFLSLPSFM